MLIGLLASRSPNWVLVGFGVAGLAAHAALAASSRRGIGSELSAVAAADSTPVAIAVTLILGVACSAVAAVLIAVADSRWNLFAASGMLLGGAMLFFYGLFAIVYMRRERRWSS